MTTTRAAPAPWWRGLDLKRYTVAQLLHIGYGRGFARGWQLGLAAGRQDADDEAAAAWAPVAARVRRNAGAPSFAEVCDRRGEPGRAARAREQEVRLGLREAS
jgi:hypothetical protein